MKSFSRVESSSRRPLKVPFQFWVPLYLPAHRVLQVLQKVQLKWVVVQTATNAALVVEQLVSRDAPMVAPEVALVALTSKTIGMY